MYPIPVGGVTFTNITAIFKYSNRKCRFFVINFFIIENIENILKNDEPFDPEKAFKQMLELNDKATELSHSDKEERMFLKN